VFGGLLWDTVDSEGLVDTTLVVAGVEEDCMGVDVKTGNELAGIFVDGISFEVTEGVLVEPVAGIPKVVVAALVAEVDVSGLCVVVVVAAVFVAVVISTLFVVLSDDGIADGVERVIGSVVKSTGVVVAWFSAVTQKSMLSSFPIDCVTFGIFPSFAASSLACGISGKSWA
jgi:hypothetical protein